MKYLMITIFALGLIITSCSKDKKALKNIEGQWNITAMTSDSAGVVTDEYAALQAMGVTSFTMEFVKCDPGATCNVYQKAAGSFMGFPIDQTDTTSYSISSDAKTLTIDGDPLDIITLTSSKLEVSGVDSGQTNTIKLTKI
jgi:hypothetical protein